LSPRPREPVAAGFLAATEDAALARLLVVALAILVGLAAFPIWRAFRERQI